MNNTQIKNILFDLGGVILDLDKLRCIKAFNAIGVPVTADYLGVYGQTGLLGELEVGEISDSEFYNRFRNEFNCNVSDDIIRDAWNAYLVGIPRQRLRLLQQLKKQFRLYLLSNTSSIHTDFWEPMFVTDNGEKGSKFFFDGVYCSFRTGLVKPNADAFRNVLQSAGILPEETLFFDDSPANIEVAANIGFNTFYVHSDTDLLHFGFDKLV